MGTSKLQKSLGGPPEKSIKNEGLNFWKMDEAAKTIKHCFRYQDISSILPPGAVQM